MEAAVRMIGGAAEISVAGCGPRQGCLRTGTSGQTDGLAPGKGSVAVKALDSV